MQIGEPVHELPAAGEPVQQEPLASDVEPLSDFLHHRQHGQVETDVAVPDELEVVQVVRIADPGREQGGQHQAALLLGPLGEVVPILRPAPPGSVLQYGQGTGGPSGL